jgi:hypothetical protein
VKVFFEAVQIDLLNVLKIDKQQFVRQVNLSEKIKVFNTLAFRSNSLPINLRNQSNQRATKGVSFALFFLDQLQPRCPASRVKWQSQEN